MIKQSLVNKLDQLSSFNTNDEIMEFLDIISDIAENGDVAYLPKLFDFLEDEPDLVDVRDSIMMIIERYPISIYIPYLLSNLKMKFTTIPECCEIFVSRLLHKGQDILLLKQNIHLVDKETMLKLLDNLENDEYCPEVHKPIIKELRELVRE
jgi:hypothetical protein